MWGVVGVIPCTFVYMYHVADQVVPAMDFSVTAERE